MIRFVSAAALLACLAVASAEAGLIQDPTKTLPDNYKVEFENDYVRIVRVHYDAGAKLPDHTHPGGTTIYVYLDDADGVVFRHSSGSSSTVNRPPVKAGGMRIATGPEEHHSAENTSKAATDFLRIYLKTDTGTSRSTRRMPPGEASFENKLVRITRMTLEQHDVETIDAKTPVLLVEWPSGNDRWIEAGTSATVENHDARTVNLVRIELLTKPK